MNQLLSEQDKNNFLQILAELNSYHAKIFTNKELSEHFKISERKIIDFKHGKIFDFWLLIQYAAIIGKNVNFDLI